MMMMGPGVPISDALCFKLPLVRPFAYRWQSLHPISHINQIACCKLVVGFTSDTHLAVELFAVMFKNIFLLVKMTISLDVHKALAHRKGYTVTIT